MKLAIYLKNEDLENDARFIQLTNELSLGGCNLYRVSSTEELEEGTDLLLSVGGDGTFLKSAAIVAESGLPILGLNFGRLGFLSENVPSDIAKAIIKDEFIIEKRSLLSIKTSLPINNSIIESHPFAINEVCMHRSTGAMLGVNVRVDGAELPTYWADGLLVATSTGSTAYSLSVGGPILLPESKVLIISPIAPHNLNVRPLIVPDTSEIELRFIARNDKIMFSLDNRSTEIDANIVVKVSMAHYSLNRLRLKGSNFINTLTNKLFWGEDLRNNITNE